MPQKTKHNYEEVWENLHQAMIVVLSRFGSEWDFLDEVGDYWIIDEPYGFDQHNVYFYSFEMFRPVVIKELQVLLKQYSGWEIFVTTFIKPGGENWPDMGLIIREHEIIDGLQRQYFPPEYQSIQYEGSRVGTDKD
jgi:hypothetical protein